MIAWPLAVGVLLAAAPAGQEPRHDAEAIAVLEKMASAGAALESYTMTLVKRERFGKELEPEEHYLVKWQRPQRIYLKQIVGPREGQEVLYSPGANKDRVKVRKSGFPSFNVNLDPRGRLAMAHAHHPLTEVSIPRFVARVVDNVGRARKKGVGTVRLLGREGLFGVATVKLEMTTPPTGTTPTLARGQTLWTLADVTGQSMYVILHANRHRNWTQADHPQPGDAVLVPEYYAGRMTLWVDEATSLPVQADLYDHDGQLYEHYEHRDLKPGIPLTPLDFDPKNPAYGF